MEYQNVTLRVPVDLVKQIDALAAEKSKALSLRVDRSQVIRQAMAKAVEEAKALECKGNQKGGAK